MLENNIINLSELSTYFPNRNYYEITKDTLLYHFDHLEFIKIKVLKIFLKNYIILLKEKYEIKENFEQLFEVLEKYKGWFVDLSK